MIGDDAVGLRSDVERRPDDAVVIGTLGEAVNLVTSEKDNVLCRGLEPTAFYEPVSGAARVKRLSAMLVFVLKCTDL